MTLNTKLEKYRKHLTPLNLSKEEENEAIGFVWNLCSEFAAAAFGHHPVQQAINEGKGPTLQDNSKAGTINQDKEKD